MPSKIVANASVMRMSPPISRMSRMLTQILYWSRVYTVYTREQHDNQMQIPACMGDRHGDGESPWLGVRSRVCAAANADAASARHGKRVPQHPGAQGDSHRHVLRSDGED